MSKRDIKLYVEGILELIKAIEKFVEGADFESFKEDEKASSAVIRKFEIIGEATKNIPQSIKEKYLHISRREILGLCDRLIRSHFEYKIQYDVVWDTIKLKLPELRNNIERIPKDLEGER